MKCEMIWSFKSPDKNDKTKSYIKTMPIRIRKKDLDEIKLICDVANEKFDVFNVELKEK